ncbi:MAG TPA: nuclear transport factor 2 family protein [Candidatus Limnocylindria bacterium]|nr:nuclear transport factor 2 family protein [Candidatus Limnocylindria bacterium]
MTLDARQVVAAVVDVWNGASTDHLESLLAPAYRGHMLGVPNGERDAAAYPAAIGGFRARFTGAEFRIAEQLDAGDRLVSRLEARRPGAGAGESLVCQGMNISRFDEVGRLAEEWAIWSGWLAESAPADAG